MRPIENLRDLFIEQLEDRYDSEMQQIKAIPDMVAHHVSSTKLRRVLEKSVQQSEAHIKKLERIFKLMKADPVGELCEGALGLFHETWELLRRCTDVQVKDAAVVTSIQHLHHHDIAGYGTLAAFAKALEMDEVAHVLHDISEEEKTLDDLLSDMAMNSINLRANSAFVEHA